MIGWWWVPSTNHTTRACRVCTTFPTPLTLTRHPDPLDATVETMMDCTISNRRRLRVIAQCKAEKRKMGPAYLRELEGVVYRYATASAPHPSESESDSSHIPQAITSNDDTNPTPRTAAAKEPPPPPIALLVSESAFTRNCLLTAHVSPLPFLLVHLPRNSSTGAGAGGTGGGNGGSAIGAIFGNPALVSSKGVLGGELEIRWERGGSSIPSSQSSQQSSSSSSGVLSSAGRPRLWWQGQPLPSWTPDAGAVEVDGDGVLLNQR